MSEWRHNVFRYDSATEALLLGFFGAKDIENNLNFLLLPTRVRVRGKGKP